MAGTDLENLLDVLTDAFSNADYYWDRPYSRAVLRIFYEEGAGAMKILSRYRSIRFPRQNAVEVTAEGDGWRLRLSATGIPAHLAARAFASEFLANTPFDYNRAMARYDQLVETSGFGAAAEYESEGQKRIAQTLEQKLVREYPASQAWTLAARRELQSQAQSYQQLLTLSEEQYTLLSKMTAGDPELELDQVVAGVLDATSKEPARTLPKVRKSGLGQSI